MHEEALAIIDGLITRLKRVGDHAAVSELERVRGLILSMHYTLDDAISEANYYKEIYKDVVPPPADEKDDTFWLEMYEDYHSDED
jgi:hypothetical protein